MVIDALITGFIEGDMLSIIHFELGKVPIPFDFLGQIFVELTFQVKTMAMTFFFAAVSV